MTDNSKLHNFAKFVRENYPGNASEIADAIELVSIVMDDTYAVMSTDLIKNTENKIFNHLYVELENLANIQKDISEYRDLFIDETAEDNILAEERIDEEEEKKNPDYKAYYVDSTVPHSLYEDFTYTKACAFMFKGIKYEVKNMKDVLISLCEILAEENREKMLGFISDKNMQGRKAPYFSNRLIEEKGVCKNAQIGNLNVYVWINLSCNGLRNIIRRVLAKYNYKLESFKIYLRADYTAIHRGTSDLKSNVNTYEEKEKIGKHVQACFRQLENYPFSANELIAMQSENWTFETFGFRLPLIKEYNPSISVKEQIQVGMYNRYWKSPYKLCGKKYFVASQWFEIHRDRFDKWFNSLNI